MKVKVFTNYDETALCSDINDFLCGIEVIDIKYSNIADSDGQCFYTVLIIFK